MNYDEHEPCRREIAYIREQAAKRVQDVEIYRRGATTELGDHHYERLKILQIDWFEDKLRVVVA